MRLKDNENTRRTHIAEYINECMCREYGGSDAEDKRYKVLKLFTRKTKILINFKF